MEIGGAIGMELFVSIHMNCFVLYPLAKVFFKNSSIKGLVLLNIIRAAILLYCDFFVSTLIATIDFMAVFVGAFVIVPLVLLLDSKSEIRSTKERYNVNQYKNEYEENKTYSTNSIDYEEGEISSYYDDIEEDDDPIKNL